MSAAVKQTVSCTGKRALQIKVLAFRINVKKSFLLKDFYKFPKIDKNNLDFLLKLKTH